MLEDYAGQDEVLHPDARAALDAVGACWEDEEEAEAHLRTALELAPQSLAARVGAYKFYFYRHRLAEALPHAQSCLDLAADKLGLPRDWRRIGPESAAFGGFEAWPRLYLQALIAYGYGLIRVDRVEDGRDVLTKAAELDQTGRFGAARLLETLDRGDEDEDEDGEGFA